MKLDSVGARTLDEANDTIDPGETLPWDSEFWGVITARVLGHRLTAASAAAIDRWCLRHGVRFLYLLADVNDIETSRIAEDHHYRLTDVRMTFGCSPSRALASGRSVEPDGQTIRTVRQDDIETLARIARESYTDTRFYADAHLMRSRCDDLYETWIRRSCEGDATTVLVADVAGEVVGYVTCHLDDNTSPSSGTIGLVGVIPSVRGRGLGRALVNRALRWFVAHQAESVTVVTQGRNLVAQRLYQGVGFITLDVQLWYHKWYLPQEGSHGAASHSI